MTSNSRVGFPRPTPVDINHIGPAEEMQCDARLVQTDRQTMGPRKEPLVWKNRRILGLAMDASKSNVVLILHLIVSAFDISLLLYYHYYSPS